VFETALHLLQLTKLVDRDLGTKITLLSSH
jgi:hypothetical protein